MGTIFLKNKIKIEMSSSSSSSKPIEKILNEIRSTKCFNGFVKKFSHQSVCCSCEMKLSVFLPKEATEENKVPAIFWLSGLTCNEDNFIQKAGAQRVASELGVALICSDTSPRGCNIEGEDESWDFGTGAGFYVDATEEKWKENYNMYSYVSDELPAIVATELPIDSSRFSIFGHSMGGHGALVIGLRNYRLFKTISAFAPVSQPTECAWGQKAFKNYLGEKDKSKWLDYDAVALLQHYEGDYVDVLIDQGTDDKFLKDGQLRTEELRQVASKANNASIVVRMQHGYDHSYHFIATFIEDHIRYHAERLGIEINE